MIVGVHELLAVTAGAAIVGRDDEIALINDVLDQGIETIDKLECRAAVNRHNRRKLSVGRDVVRYIDKRGDGELAVAAWIVNQVGLDHVGTAQASDQRVGDWLRLPRRKLVG